MPVTGQRYTISQYAHEGLYQLLVIRQPRPRFSTFEADVDGKIVPDALHIQQNKEGVSHALNVLHMFHNIEEWTDDRPIYIQGNHKHQLEPPPLATRQEAIEYYSTMPRYQAKSKWYYEPFKEFERDVEEDDTPWDKLDEREQYVRRQYFARLKRVRIELALDDNSRNYYSALAKYHKMQPLSRTHNHTAYVSAALNAIGIGWLLPPQDYIDTLKEMHNRNKKREDFGGLQNRLTFGNPNHTPWMRTLDEINAALSPMKIEPKTQFTQQELDFYTKFDYPELAEQAAAYLAEQDRLNPVLKPESTPEPVLRQPDNKIRSYTHVPTTNQQTNWSSMNKLTQAQVEEAFLLWTTPPKPMYKTLATRYQVSVTTIRRLLYQEQIRREQQQVAQAGASL